jgi:hypothetical protein
MPVPKTGGLPLADVPIYKRPRESIPRTRGFLFEGSLRGMTTLSPSAVPVKRDVSGNP